jgi:hypothetical protein
MNAEIAKAKFDLLWWEIDEAVRKDPSIYDAFLKHLETDYDLIDRDKARDLARDGNL